MEASITSRSNVDSVVSIIWRFPLSHQSDARTYHGFPTSKLLMRSDARNDGSRIPPTSAIICSMSLILELPAGLTGTAELVVGEQHTAPRIGSGRIRVLATPVMINLIEAAALAAIEQSLPEFHQSLGTRLDISHVAATPVGMRVRATAEVVRVEGRTVHLRVRAEDERELIGEGTHERVVVNVERFDARVQAKLKR
jgi:fluoroacetyl-CoA thioesterase